MSSSNSIVRRVAPAAQTRAYLQAVLRTRSRVSSRLEQPAMDASLAFSWLSQFSSTWLAPPPQRGSRPRVSSATGGCWTRHTTARCCALLASPARKGAKQWCRVPSGLVGGPALRSYSKRRAKGSADLSAGRTRLRVRFTVPGSRCPHVFALGRPRERKHTRTGRLWKKCTVMASIGALVSGRGCRQPH